MKVTPIIFTSNELKMNVIDLLELQLKKHRDKTFLEITHRVGLTHPYIVQAPNGIADLSRHMINKKALKEKIELECF